MKIRTDHVTNSSSSSFVLNLYEDKDKVLMDLLNEMIIPPHMESTINVFEAKKKELAASVKGSKFLRGLYVARIGYYTKLITEIKRLQKGYKKNKRRTLLAYAKLYLKYEGLTISKEDDKLEVSGNIAMYNGIGDIPGIINEMLTYAMISEIPFNWENKEDNYS